MDKQLKDYLHLYLGCRIKVWSDNYKNEEFNLTPTFLDLSRVPHYTIKPILRKLSSMTEEEKKEIGYDAYMIMRMEQSPTELTTHRGVLWSARQTAYLLKQGFDLFGLIESGLAIDSATLNH